MHWMLLDDNIDYLVWYELSVDNDKIDYLWCCELSICVYLDNELNCFKLKQLGPKRHALDFDETGIGFPYLDIRKPHRFQITLGR